MTLVIQVAARIVFALGALWVALSAGVVIDVLMIGLILSGAGHIRRMKGRWSKWGEIRSFGR